MRVKVALTIAIATSVLLTMPVNAKSKGEELVYNRKKGNCIACHFIQGGNLPGNAGPPLVAMKTRYVNKSKLRAQIDDATAANPNSFMPPFGKYEILSGSEIDAITDYIYTL